jgi:hypothetical protein
MMSTMPILPILPNVPVQPSLRIGNGENQPPCPTNMPPPAPAAPTVVPLGERSVNVVRAPVPAARTLTLQERKEEEKAVKRARATCEKKRKIAEANQRDRQIMSVQPLLVTPPDMKPAIVLTDDMKPAFRVGEYVRVKGDTSPGHNRPDGYAFIKQVRGHGAATLSSIQMVEVYGGNLFRDVRMQFMTPATFLGSEIAATPKRKRMAPSSTVTPSPISKKKPNNHKMPVEILVERLEHGSRHGLKKGWYRDQERSKRAAAGREGENGKTLRLLRLRLLIVLTMVVALRSLLLFELKGRKWQQECKEKL